MSIFKRKQRTTAPAATAATGEQDAEQPATGYEGKPGSLDIYAMHEHLLVNSAGTWAWYLMGDVSWLCIDDDKSDEAFTSLAHRLASLTGRTFKLRITSSPFDSYTWAANIDATNPAPYFAEAATPNIPGGRNRLADTADGDKFYDALERAQLRQQELGARDHAVAIGVLLTDQRLTEHKLRKVLSPNRLGNNEGLLEELRSDLASITLDMSKKGVDGVPLDKVEMAWLMHASAGMGAPVPPMMLRGNAARYWKSQAAGIGKLVYAESRPFSKTTIVHAMRGADEVTNHVAVMYVTDVRTRDLDDRSKFPFLAWPQTRPYGVEVFAQFKLVDGRDKKAEVKRYIGRAKSIESDFHDFDEDPPAEVARGLERARQLEDEITNGDRVTRVTAEGWVLMAVTGETEQEAKDRANDLISAADEEMQMTLVKPNIDQHGSYRAFIPSEHLPISEGLDVEWPLSFLASGVPNATTAAGDRTGMFVGPILGGHSIFLLDMLGGAKNDESNVIIALGGQGSGKSTLGGKVLAWNARLGRRAVGNDPSGMWKALCDVPSLKADARHLDLFDCKPGTLTPSLMVPEPRQEHFDTIDDFETAIREAKQARLSATIDALRNLLPAQLVANDGRIIAALREAVTAAGGHYGVSPWEAIDKLAQMPSELGPDLARMLTTASELRGGMLILGDRHHDTDDSYITSLMEQATLTIVTMKGLSHAAKGSAERAHWNDDQSQAEALLNLAALFSSRVIYSDKEGKSVWNDELGMSGGIAGGAFATTFSKNLVDSRKWNAQIGLIGQNPSMFFDLNKEIANLAGQVWVGRLKKDAAKAALDLLDLPHGYRFEEIITHLPQEGPRQFLVRDWHGNHPIVQVDQDSWDPAELTALETNPYGRQESAGRRRLGVAV